MFVNIINNWVSAVFHPPLLLHIHLLIQNFNFFFGELLRLWGPLSWPNQGEKVYLLFLHNKISIILGWDLEGAVTLLLVSTSLDIKLK